MKATVSRRQMLAAAAVTPTATLAANETHASHFSAADPVFAAIEQHRQAAQALSAAYQLPDAILDQRQRAEEDALLAWLTTVPITMAGAIATLEHASRRPYVNDYRYDYVHANLAESAQYSDDVLEAGERFPQMVATALRKIVGR